MFGNREGWIISGVLVVIFAGLLYWLSEVQQPSPPTASFQAEPKFLAAIELPIAPETIVTNMTDPGDAAEHYRKVIDEYTAHSKDYARYKAGQSEALPGIVELLAGARCKEMHLFSKKPTEIMNYSMDKDSIDALVAVGKLSSVIGLAALRSKKVDEATRYAEAEFSLGAKLFNERIIYPEMSAGFGQMSTAVDLLKMIADDAGDKPAAERYLAFNKQTLDYKMKYIQPTNKFVPAADDTILATHAGDVFALVDKSKDRMWRVEAMLQLGRMRYNVGENGRSADQIHANRLLKKYAEPANEKDDIVRAAAVMARDLDSATYNNQTATAHSN